MQEIYTEIKPKNSTKIETSAKFQLLCEVDIDLEKGEGKGNRLRKSKSVEKQGYGIFLQSRDCWSFSSLW